MSPAIRALVVATTLALLPGGVLDAQEAPRAMTITDLIELPALSTLVKDRDDRSLLEQAQ